MGSSRPPRLPPGAPLSEHYTIEGLVRYSEGRMFYLANDKRPDRPYRFCWECGSDETPRQATHCINCGIEMAHREFLISLRWDHDAHNFVDFFEQEFEHGSMIVPIDLFQERGAMCSVIDWNQEDFLLNQSSPLSTETLLDLAQRICGMLGYLHQKGISLSNIQAGNFLVRPDNNYIHFFDPDIQSIQKKPIEGEAQAQEIPFLAQLLLRYCSISETSTALMLRNAVEGAFKSPYEFGRAIEQELLNIRTEHSAGAVAAVSDVGLVRNLNEDNWGWREINDTLNIYVVADGMGGHDAGEVASHMAVNGLCDELENKLKNALKPEITLLQQVLHDSFRYANNSIKSHSIDIGSDMGTTMVCALVSENHTAFIANVGDSRAYLIRNHQLHQISKDHSLVSRMVDEGHITVEEARVHPNSNILLRTVGTEMDVEVDVFTLALEPKDIILLCSDGLWGEVSDTNLEFILNSHPDLRVVAQKLLQASHIGGGKDNCTHILFQVS